MKHKAKIGWFVTVAFIALLNGSTANAQVNNGTANTDKELIFGKGERAPQENFTGTVWVTCW